MFLRLQYKEDCRKAIFQTEHETKYLLQQQESLTIKAQ